MAGLAEVIRRDFDARRRGMKAALLRAGQYMAEQVRQNVIRKNLIKTGALRDSIDVEIVDAHTVRVVAPVEHAGYLEYGTSKMKPHPFFNEAIQKSKRTVEKIMRDAKKEAGI